MRLTQHDDLVDRRDIDSFVEDVDGEDIVELTGFEAFDNAFAFSDRVFARERDRSETSAAKRALADEETA